MRKLFYIIPLFIFAFTFTGGPSSWTQITLPVNDVVNDIFFIDSLNGWAVTNGSFAGNDTAYILHTTNGGDNWLIQNAKLEQLNIIKFFDVNTGYAAGGRNGTIFVSFYKTTNGGDNWAQLNTLNGVAIEGMSFINKDTGWVSDPNGLTGGISKTTNGGINWAQQVNSGLFSRRVYFTTPDTGWFIDGQLPGHLYKSTNGGANWVTQFTAPDDLRNIYFLNSQTGFVIGPFGGHSLKKTTNGGINWISTTGSSGGTGINFPNENTGWICAGAGTVQKSTDGGLNWFRIGFSLFADYNSIYFTDPLHGWLAGSKIFKTTDGGITNINFTGTGIPGDFELYQNYPNPFNPSTSIKFKVQSLKNIKLSVNDITGKEIAALVNEKLSAGEYEYTFDGSGLTSGIYFYTLFADGIRVDTKKMVLIK